MGITCLLHALNCLSLAFSSAGATAKAADSHHQHPRQDHRWQNDAKVPSLHRSPPGAFAVDVSAQTNGFLRLSDAHLEHAALAEDEKHLNEHVRARLIRSETSHSMSIPPGGSQDSYAWSADEEKTWGRPLGDFFSESQVSIDADSRAGKEIHSHNAVPFVQASRGGDSQLQSTDEVPDLPHQDPQPDIPHEGANVSAAVNDWSAVQNQTHQDTIENAQDDDWSTVLHAIANSTNHNVSASGPNATPPNASASEPDGPVSGNISGPGGTVNATLPANVSVSGPSIPRDNATGPNISTDNATGPNISLGGNASGPNVTLPNASGLGPNISRDNATRPNASNEATTTTTTTTILVPAPAPPPVVIINKITNNITVHVTVNVTAGGNRTGTQVTSRANIADGSNKSAQAGKSDEKAAEGRPMDIWKSIVGGAKDDSKIGATNARVDDPSL